LELLKVTQSVLAEFISSTETPAATKKLKIASLAIPLASVCLVGANFSISRFMPLVTRIFMEADLTNRIQAQFWLSLAALPLDY
jgi:hypothetical protein